MYLHILHFGAFQSIAIITIFNFRTPRIFQDRAVLLKMTIISF